MEPAFKQHDIVLAPPAFELNKGYSYWEGFKVSAKDAHMDPIHVQFIVWQKISAIDQSSSERLYRFIGWINTEDKFELAPEIKNKEKIDTGSVIRLSVLANRFYANTGIEIFGITKEEFKEKYFADLI